MGGGASKIGVHKEGGGRAVATGCRLLMYEWEEENVCLRRGHHGFGQLVTLENMGGIDSMSKY